MQKLEGGKKVTEGYCLRCARELGFDPFKQMFGDSMSEKDRQKLESQYERLMDNPEIMSMLEEGGLEDMTPEEMAQELKNCMESLNGGEFDGNIPDDLFGLGESLDEEADDEEAEGEEAEEGDGESEDKPHNGFMPFDFGMMFGNKAGASSEDSDSENGEEEDAPKKKDKKGKKQKGRENLERFCTNLTRKAADGAIDRVIGRDRELDRVMQILCRRQKNNPCLIGEPGVGKTAVAEALALRISEGSVPARLLSKEIYLVDMTALVAGTQFRGQFEKRLKDLIDEVQKLGNIVLVIDEVHSIVSAGGSEGGMNAGNILKPALSRGEIQVIGATTLSEYRKYIEKDTALERRFQPVMINEPSVAESIKILEGIKSYYEEFHGVRIPAETVEKAVVYSERYITDRFLPDKAIDLLDEAASYLSINDISIAKCHELEDEIDLMKAELTLLEERAGSDDSPEVYRELLEVRGKLAHAEKEHDRFKGAAESVTLLPEHLSHCIEIWTGIPASSINESEFIRVDRLEERLKDRIVGQDEAVSLCARAIKRSRAGIAAKRKPVSFIFAGPTGVGKTELVKTIANDLFDSPEALIRLDMSEFMEKHAVSRIIGAPPGYVGYDEAGQLTEKIRRRPYSVVLFDEIEKAHPDVLNILLQILDDGKVTDAQGRQINFENTMIVLTTNAGSSTGTNSVGFSGTEGSVAKDRIMKALSDFLRPEFLNRIDEIIIFNSLSQDNFKDIARIMLEDLKVSLAEKNITFEYTDSALEFIASKSFSRKFGARNLRRFITTEIEDRAAELVIAKYDSGIRGIFVSGSDDGLSVVEVNV